MPIDKIESRSEAAKAFREGAYFKVGDRFISPDEIVTARRDSSGNPVFELTTGATVVHGQFQEGSVGHFLFEQLRKVEGRYVETIKPDFNRVLFPGDTSPALLDGSGTLTQGLKDFGGIVYEKLDLNARLFFAADNNNGGVKIGDLSGNQEFAWNGGPSGDTQAFTYTLDVDPNAQKVFFGYENGGGTFKIAKANYDGTNPVQIASGFSGKPISLRVDVSDGIGILIIDGTGFATVDLGGAGTSVVSSQTAAFAGVFYDIVPEKDVAVGASDRNGQIQVLDYSGNILRQSGVSAQVLGSGENVSYQNGRIYWLNVSDVLTSVDFDTLGDEKTVMQTPSNNRAGLDVALDLSAL